MNTRQTLLLLIGTTVVLGSCVARPKETKTARTKVAAGDSRALERIGEEYWEELMRHSPTWATYLGDRRRDAELGSVSDEEHRRHLDVLRALQTRLSALDPEALDSQARITADVLQNELSNTFRGEVCRTRLWQVDQLAGPQVTFPELPSYHTIEKREHARDLAARYRAMKGYYAGHVENLRRGMKAGYLPPRQNVERVLAQLDAQLELPAAKSPYFDAVELPDAWPPEQKEEAQETLMASIEEGVYPGLSSYRAFLRTELLPAARETVGVSEIPRGEACYAARIQEYTGSTRTANELHALGLEEVKRIRGEMIALIPEPMTEEGTGMRRAQSAAAAGETDGVKAYLDRLQKRPDQYLDTSQALLDYNRKLVARAQAALPKAFGTLPKTPVEVKAIESFREKDAPAAYYYSAPEDGSRPAYYYVNTYDPASRPLYNMAALAFHEAVPGHHLQIALANENKALPKFQRQLGQTAFIEGWALYAEELAGELGLYRDRNERLGALNYEIWRAVRLVVDTGMHAKGWSRDEALTYFLEQTAHSRQEAVAEIDRYVTWPGQALAYKYGQLEIRSMRADAEERLGDRFDLAAFHDRLLSHGAVPLPTARRDIETWITGQLGDVP